MVVKTLLVKNPHWCHGFEFTANIIESPAHPGQYRYTILFVRAGGTMASGFRHEDDELFDSVDKCILGLASYYSTCPACACIRRNEVAAYLRKQRKSILDTQLSLF